MSGLETNYDFQARDEDGEKLYVSVQHDEAYHGEDVCIFISEKPLSGESVTLRMTHQQAGRLAAVLWAISKAGVADPDEVHG